MPSRCPKLRKRTTEASKTERRIKPRRRLPRRWQKQMKMKEDEGRQT